MTVLCFFPFLPAYLVSISPNLVFSILVWSLTLTKEAFLKCLVIFGYSSYLRMGSCELYCKDIRLGHFTEEILFFFLINLFICFWLCWVFVAVRGFSLVAVSGGYSSLQCMGFSLQWLLLLWSTGSRHTGFSSCGPQAQQLWLLGSRAQAQQLWHTGLVALRHVGSSWSRDRTHVPCHGRRILNHCATGEVLIEEILNVSIFKSFKLVLIPIFLGKCHFKVHSKIQPFHYLLYFGDLLN